MKRLKKLIKRFPAMGKSHTTEYPKLRGLIIPNGWTLAIIDLNILNETREKVQTRTIAHKAAKIIWPKLSRKVQHNSIKLNIITQKPRETYIQNRARYGLSNLKMTSLVKSVLIKQPNKRKHTYYYLTPIGYFLINQANDYLSQYNNIMQALNKNIRKYNLRPKESNINRYVVTRFDKKINRKMHRCHLHVSKRKNINNPIKAAKKALKAGNNGENKMKEKLQLFYNEKKYSITYKSPYLNPKYSNDSFGCDAVVTNLKTHKVIYIDAKQSSNNAFQFYMSANEIALLKDAVDNTSKRRKEYDIYFFNKKGLCIYRTGEANNGINDSNGRPRISFHESNKVFKIDQYQVTPTIVK